jgi:hypothetical protein
MTWICTLANIGILAYGAITDYNRREIPDAVPIVLLLTGLLTGWEVLLYRLAAMLLTAAVFIIAAKLSKSGIPVLLASLLLTGLGAGIVGIAKKQPTKRNIPLCSYIAPAYTVVCGLQLILLLQGGAL